MMTPEEENEYYSDPENRRLTGTPVRRRRPPLGTPVPARFPDDLLDAIREQAAEDDRSLSSWLREAAREKLARDTHSAADTTTHV